jgi:suppressor for copper-sensitivity B
MRCFFYFLTIFYIFNFSFSSVAAEYDAVKVKLKFAKYSDQEILFAVDIKLKDGWKIYDNKQYSLGFPTEISVEEGSNIGDIKVFFPAGKKFIEYGEYVTYGYENHVLLPVKTKALDSKLLVDGKLKVNFALCNNICIAKEIFLDFSIKPSFLDRENLQQINKVLDNYEENILASKLWYLIAAIIAGFILNFMPCILPVLFLKIYNILHGVQAAKANIRKSSFATILGIFTAFLIFSLIVIMLQFLGKNIGWGLHFQQPLFVVFLMIVITIFAASIFDFIVIDLPAIFKEKLLKLKIKDESLFKDFFSGVLAAILATPCSAPFLGTAMIFAFAGSYVNSLLIFMAIACGFSLPYLFLLLCPKILNLLPKPGKWMQNLKYIMGSFLILTVIWLAYVLLAQIGFLAVSLIIVQIFIIFKFLKHKKTLFSFMGVKIYYFMIILNISIIFLVTSVFYANYSKVIVKNDVWLNYHEVDIAVEIAKGNIIFVNVTADWCITCKFNEFTVLKNKKILQIFARDNIYAVKADFTNKNAEIKKLLDSVGRYAVPTYIIYSRKNPQGTVLRDVITSEYLVERLLNETKD